MFTKKSALAFSLLMLSLNLQAGEWNPATQDHFAQYYHPLEDSFVSTVQGLCRDRAPRYWQMVTPVKDYHVKSTYLDSGKLPIKLALQRNEEGRVIKAPLIFAIPGAFNNLNDGMPRQFTDAFTRLGYHVVTFPNPWGTEYIKNKPYYPTGSVVQEGESLYEAIRKVYGALNEKDFVEQDQVKLYGVSYGGFLSVMIEALDAQSHQPIVTSDVTAVSPPFNLAETLDQLDSLIMETQPFIGIGLFDTLKKGLSVCLASSESDVDQEKRKNAKGLAIGAGFHADLINSMRAYDKAWRLRSIPHSRWGSYSPVFRRWMRSMSFTRYYEAYAPEALKDIHTKKGDLYSWMQKSQEAGSHKSRIVVASDDFLNDNTHWPQAVHEKETTILEHGGHYGFRSLRWYKLFQKKALFNP